ncbi:MAG: membrane dipeptidase [Burkholderiales bacterium]|nr:membrane dipeptidase [Burkholderiales bacterium]
MTPPLPSPGRRRLLQTALALAAAHAKGLLVDRIDADHVAFGTDVEGIEPNWALNSCGDVRKVIANLEEMKLPASAIERVACLDYARVLKAALKG